MLDKRVVFFGSPFCQRLEPVCIVCDALFCGPLFHALSHGISHFSVESCPIVHHINHFLIDALGQVLIHFLTVEDLASEKLRWSVTWCGHVEWFFLESLADYLKS